MATWAMKQRYAHIDALLEAGEAFTRADLCEKFYITTQTATATLNEYRAANPDKLQFDKHARRFIRADMAMRPARLTRLEAVLLDGCRALDGLLTLVLGRDDLTPELREAISTSHRREEARAAIAKATTQSEEG